MGQPAVAEREEFEFPEEDQLNPEGDCTEAALAQAQQAEVQAPLWKDKGHYSASPLMNKSAGSELALVLEGGPAGPPPYG